MQEILKVVGRRVRKYRERKGWSQDVMADKSGLHRAQIGAIERGERNVTLRTLKTIADTYEIRIRDVIGDV
jgi:transcriptional regulator with XRE-family HTH domain